MIPGKHYTPELVLTIGWRRKWLILIPAVLVAAVAGAVTYTLPDLYRSEASILVVPQRVPESYVKSAVTTRLDDRLRSINQQVRSRTKLERIIDELDLYPERRKTGILQDVIDAMNGNIDVDIVQGDVFKIAFTSGDPRTAMQVTERLTTFFIDESHKDRAQIADQAGEFLESEATRAERQLRDTEQKLAEYKRRHAGELPTQVDANQSGLQNSSMQLITVAQQLDSEKDEQRRLLRRIDEVGALIEAAAANPRLAQEPGAPQGKAAQLLVAKEELRKAQDRYGKTHPTLNRLEEKVAQLEREAAEEAAAVTALGPAVVTNPGSSLRHKELADLKTELEHVNRRISNLTTQHQFLTQQMNDYQRRMDAAPGRDSELVDLTRDYATQKALYDSLMTKKMDSQISANLERGQIGEQFKILDQARLPEKPYSPKRQRLYLISLVLAIGAGLGAAAGAEYLDRGLRSEDDVRLALALPVLATIPEIGPSKKKFSLRRKAAAGSAAAVVLTAAVGAAWLALR